MPAPSPRTYILQVREGHEKKVEKQLVARFGDLVEPIIPTNLDDPKQVLYGGYVSVEIRETLTEALWNEIRQVPGVIRFLGRNGEPFSF